MNRQIPQDISEYPFDLIVVGAGINGAGIARDAAMRGLKVLLLDKGDISDGTTQWSTRLIHGGLRYLEHYEVALVRESLKDREKLIQIAPHLVKPLGFLVPVYDRSQRGPFMIKLGMVAYDVLSADKSMENHKMFNREQTLEREPGLNPEGLKAAAFYYDAQVEYAERLAVENAISAKERGAYVLNYARVDRLITDDNAVTGVEFTDVLSGEQYKAFAPVTVNVAGPWVDRVLGSLSGVTSENAAEVDGAGGDAGDDGDTEPMIGGTKGSHLVVDPFPGAPQDEALYVEARKDGRPYFIVPWNGRYLIGTTDIRYDDDLDRVSAEEDEIDYLIDETNYVIPEVNLSRDSVLFTYSGIRPLPYQPEGSTGSVTRSHIIHDHAKKSDHTVEIGGLVSIVGGKLTTYRNLSRQTMDLVYKKTGRKAAKSRTGDVPLPGGATEDFDAFSAEFRTKSGLPDDLATRLVSLYGVRAPDVLEMAGDDTSLKVPLVSPYSPETGLIGAEVIYAFKREMAQTLTDVLLRRTMAGLGPKVALDLDEAAAQVAVEHLGWDKDRADREVQNYRDYVSRYHPKEMKEAGAATV